VSFGRRQPVCSVRGLAGLPKSTFNRRYLSQRSGTGLDANIRNRTLMPNGTVKFFNATKGFGFIAPEGGGPDIFVHATAGELAGIQTLMEGQRLSFEIESDSRGEKAIKLALISAGGETVTQTDGAQSAGAISQITIYHNPDCGNSRNALAAIRLAGFEPRIVEYLKTPLTRDEIKQLARLANISIHDLVRKVEPLYAELGLDGQDDEECLDAMIKNPILINRPIVATDTVARLCRPSEAVKTFLSEAARV
jgi:arsenate reductase (glutaredoxin)